MEGSYTENVNIKGITVFKFSFGEVYRRVYRRKLVLRQCVSGAVKRDFPAYIQRYASPTENFEYGHLHSNALLTFSLQKDSEKVLCCTYTPAA